MKDFGSIIRELRKKNKITQAKLADLVGYSEKEMSRIEQNKHVPSVNLLHELSRVFNMDLNEYYKRYYSNLSIEANQYYDEINSILGNCNYDSLPAILDQSEKLEEFKLGENKILTMLGRALCAAHIDKDYMKSIDICMKALITESDDFNIEIVGSQIFSNTSYAIINCLACNYIAVNKKDIALEIYVGLIISIEKFILANDFPLYHSTDFEKKIYQLALYNVSVLYYMQTDYKKAKTYSKKGIEFSVSNNFLKNLPSLYISKMKACYSLDEIQEAQLALEYAYALFGIIGQYSKQDQLNNLITDQFPKLQLK